MSTFAPVNAAAEGTNSTNDCVAFACQVSYVDSAAHRTNLSLESGVLEINLILTKNRTAGNCTKKPIFVITPSHM